MKNDQLGDRKKIEQKKKNLNIPGDGVNTESMKKVKGQEERRRNPDIVGN